MRTIGLLLVTVAVLAGCKDKKEEKLDKLKHDLQPMIDKYAAPVKATLAAIPEIGKTAVAAPKVTERAPLARKFSFDPDRPLNSGTLLETAQLLVDRKVRVDIHIQEDLYIKRVTQMLDGTYKNPDQSAKLLEEDFTRITNIKQIAAVRFHEVRRPRADKDKVIEPGYARGDVLIYDVESKKQIGAFPFDATDDHPEVVKSTKKKSVSQSLEHKFVEAVKHAINLELVAYLDARPGPASPGREKPADKPADDKKPDDKPADAKPADAKPAEAKPAGKPADKPAGKTDAKPTDKGGAGW